LWLRRIFSIISSPCRPCRSCTGNPAEAHGANSFDYLTELQRHAEELKQNPSQWMPWNYRDTLARYATHRQPRNMMNPVRPSDAKGGRPSFESNPGGGVRATNVTLKLLIQMAYDIRPEQLSGGPGWTDSEQYTVIAKGPEGGPPLSAAEQKALTRANACRRF
jgi:hypothetical protein